MNDYAKTIADEWDDEEQAAAKAQKAFDQECENAESDWLDPDKIEIFQDIVSDYALENREFYRQIQGIMRNIDAPDYCYQLQKLWPEIVRAYKELKR